MASSRRVTIVTDLGYGDAGKGSVVDYLARTEITREPAAVVRFNGGAQAAHNVITPDGRHHTFSQFGSASFIPGARTHLSRFMLVNPLGIAREAAQLHAVGVADPQARLTIDELTLVITPYHQAANRLRELARGAGRHGSCGEGIGETMADHLDTPDEALRAADLRNPAVALHKLELARDRKLSQLAEVMRDLVSDPEAVAHIATLRDRKLSQTVVDFYATFMEHVAIVDAGYLGHLLQATPHVIFEGAQGVLLDEWRGFHPYTTWSTTTFANADQLLREQAYDGEVTHLGLLRAYATRHGTGPFVTEDAALTASIPDYHNTTNAWQREFRVGHFDLVAARYALEVAGQTDQLAITCLDRLVGAGSYRVCTAYEDGNGRSSCLIPGPFMDLAYQEQLTTQLLTSTPHYEAVRGGSSEYVAYIERELGVPVTLTSHGPRATDKRRRLIWV